MKKVLTYILFLIVTFVKSQDFSKTDKAIITTLGMSVTAYGFLKKGTSKEDLYICTSGVIFAALPYVFEKINKPVWLEVNSSGINIKLKYSKKYKKCKKLPYKIK